MSFLVRWSRDRGVPAIVVLFACLVGSSVQLLANEPAAKDSKVTADKKQASNHQRMQGAWRIDAFTNDGEKVAKDALKHMGVIIKKDTFSVQNRGKSTIQLRYKIKSNAKPKSKGTGFFDTTHTLEPGKPISQLGIFAFKDDLLRISIAPAGRPRPKDFKAAKGCSVFELSKQPVKKPKK